MKKMVILVGPPGSGKTTLTQEYEKKGYMRISQDVQGSDHIRLCLDAISYGYDIVIDRMNFSLEQRRRYSGPACDAGYEVEIIVLHESYETCFSRIMARKDHETIKDETSARAALRTFFMKYERPQPSEFLKLTFIYPNGPKPMAIICDLDGTLCNVEHRRHFVRREGKKDWAGFFGGIADDTVNSWCHDIITRLADNYKIVFCSGRGSEHEPVTRSWLADNAAYAYLESDLYMRMVGDSRQDYIVKEIILDFEILTRYKPYFFIDDRKQVYEMWRKRGYVCLACDAGDF